MPVPKIPWPGNNHRSLFRQIEDMNIDTTRPKQNQSSKPGKRIKHHAPFDSNVGLDACRLAGIPLTSAAPVDIPLLHAAILHLARERGKETWPQKHTDRIDETAALLLRSLRSLRFINPQSSTHAIPRDVEASPRAHGFRTVTRDRSTKLATKKTQAKPGKTKEVNDG